MFDPLRVLVTLVKCIFLPIVILAFLSNARAQDSDDPRSSEGIESAIQRAQGKYDKYTLRGKIKDENNVPLEGVVVEARRRGCLCSSCTAEERPCKCCIEQRSVTDYKGEYIIRLASEDATVDLVIIRDDFIQGRFAGVEVRERSHFDLSIDSRGERGPQM